MTQFPRITRDPAVMSGRACLRDSHVTASTVVTLMAAGRSHKEIIRMFPALTPEDLKEALGYAAWWLDEQDAPFDIPETHWPPPAISKPILAAEPESIEAPKALEKAPEASAAPSLEETEDALESDPEETEGEDEVLELFHPAYPDQATVILNHQGLFDRRWDTPTIAWCDIRGIQRMSGEKSIHIVLRNPEYYLASMPFFKRLYTQIKLIFDMPTLYLDTASLGVRTRDLYLAASRLWVNYRGDVRFRKKRRVRLTERTVKSEKIED